MAFALVVLGGLVWALPVRKPGQEGGHHAAHPPPGLDAFERAGVTEFKEGQRGPAFRLETLDGRHASLEDWSEKAIVLNFWATWCQPCTLEMPTLEALWRAYRERGLVVVGIAVDRGAPRALLDPYVKNLDLTFPILLDPEMNTANA
ncbi:MAG: TlpA disulfide reductase family protein, partial [Candidatus Rokuibacteriota bacterium]